MTEVEAFPFRTFVYISNPDISNPDNAPMPLRKPPLYLKAGRAPE